MQIAPEFKVILRFYSAGTVIFRFLFSPRILIFTARSESFASSRYPSKRGYKGIKCLFVVMLGTGEKSGSLVPRALVIFRVYREKREAKGKRNRKINREKRPKRFRVRAKRKERETFALKPVWTRTLLHLIQSFCQSRPQVSTTFGSLQSDLEKFHFFREFFFSHAN